MQILRVEMMHLSAKQDGVNTYQHFLIMATQRFFAQHAKGTSWMGNPRCKKPSEGTVVMNNQDLNQPLFSVTNLFLRGTVVSS